MGKLTLGSELLAMYSEDSPEFCAFLVFWKCGESQSIRVRVIPSGENGRVHGYENKC